MGSYPLRTEKNHGTKMPSILRPTTTGVLAILKRLSSQTICGQTLIWDLHQALGKQKKFELRLVCIG